MRQPLVMAAALALALLTAPLALLVAAPGALAATPAVAQADAPAHDSTVLVGLAPGADADALHRLAGVGEVAGVIEQIDVHVVAVAPGTVDTAIAAYEALPGVAYAEPNYALQLSNQPNDPLVGNQYALSVTDAFAGWAAYDPQAAFATTGGARVAVVDSGIDRVHAEFSGKVADCRNWLSATGVGLPGCQENNVHGTHVSGIAAAAANNGIGVAGIGFDAEILALQACTSVCFVADTSAAIVYAADAGADVTNYSFGGPSPSDAMRSAVAYAAARDVLQVAAAGNDGTANSVNYPAAFPEVLAVSSTDANDRLSSFSSRGAQVDVAAPGSNIFSTLPGGNYGTLSGTSMASPAVAGLGALVRSIGLDAAQARQAIVDGAELVDGARGWTPEYGHGRINVADTVRIALSRR